jgi:hypothetical protein
MAVPDDDNYGTVIIPRDVQTRFGRLDVPYILRSSGPYWFQGTLSGVNVLRDLETRLGIQFLHGNRLRLINLYNSTIATPGGSHEAAILAMLNYGREGMVQFTAGPPSHWEHEGIRGPTAGSMGYMWRDDGTLNIHRLALETGGGNPRTGADVIASLRTAGVTFIRPASFEGTDEEYLNHLAQTYDTSARRFDHLPDTVFTDGTRLRRRATHEDALEALVTRHTELTRGITPPAPEVVVPPATHYGITAPSRFFTNGIPNFTALATEAVVPENPFGTRGQAVMERLQRTGISFANGDDYAAIYDRALREGSSHERAVRHIAEYQMLRHTLQQPPANVDTPSLDRSRLPMANGTLDFRQLAQGLGTNLFDEPRLLAERGLQLGTRGWGIYMLQRMEDGQANIPVQESVERALRRVAGTTSTNNTDLESLLRPPSSSAAEELPKEEPPQENQPPQLQSPPRRITRPGTDHANPVHAGMARIIASIPDEGQRRVFGRVVSGLLAGRTVQEDVPESLRTPIREFLVTAAGGEGPATRLIQQHFPNAPRAGQRVMALLHEGELGEWTQHLAGTTQAREAVAGFQRALTTLPTNPYTGTADLVLGSGTLNAAVRASRAGHFSPQASAPSQDRSEAQDPGTAPVRLTAASTSQPGLSA